MKTFGYYKKNIDSILENSHYNKKLFKENFHVVMGALKMSKPFREFFAVYNELEQKTFKDKEELNEYINETITHLRPKIKNLKTICGVLDNVFSRRSEMLSESNNNIYEDLDYLIYKDGVRSISKRIDTKKNLVENVLNRKTLTKMSTSFNPKILAYTLSENYNKEFTNLTKEDKVLISEIMAIKKTELSEDFNKIKDTITDKINILIKESDDNSLKVRLTETKNVVSSMETSKLSILKLKQLGVDLN